MKTDKSKKLGLSSVVLMRIKINNHVGRFIADGAYDEMLFMKRFKGIHQLLRAVHFLTTLLKTRMHQ